MDWQGVLGWLMALGGACLWLWEGWKVIQRQRLENEKMKALLNHAIAAMQHLYQSHENALKFYREMVMVLARANGEVMKKKEEYTVKVAGKRYSAEDPLQAIRKARQNGASDGEIRLMGLFTAPRRLPKTSVKE